MKVGRLVCGTGPYAQLSLVVLGCPVPLAALAAALLGTSSVALAVPVGHTALHQTQAPEKPHEL